jgi:hypothetical protein
MYHTGQYSKYFELKDLCCFDYLEDMVHVAKLMLLDHGVVFPGVLCGMSRVYSAACALQGCIPLRTVAQMNTGRNHALITTEWIKLTPDHELPYMLRTKMKIDVIVPTSLAIDVEKLRDYAGLMQQKAERTTHTTISEWLQHYLQ